MFALSLGNFIHFCGANFGRSSHGRGHWVGFFGDTGVHGDGQICRGSQIFRIATGLGGIVLRLGAIHTNDGWARRDFPTHQARDFGEYGG